MDWDDLRVFLGVARTESLSRAARQLRVDPATVGRRIARLEAATGAALFLKSQQGYALTQAGQRLLPAAEAMEAATAQGTAALRGAHAEDRISGQLRIGAPDGVANHVLPQVCAALHKAHPGLEVQIVALPRVLNLSRREADLAISVSAPKAGRMTVRRLCDYHLSMAASRAYLARAAPIAEVADLSAHPIVGYIPDMIFDPELDFLPELGLVPRLASNGASVQVGLLRAGAGAGIVHDFALPHAPELTRILPDKIRFKRSFYLLRHADEARSARLNPVIDLLADAVRQEITRLEQFLDRPAP